MATTSGAVLNGLGSTFLSGSGRRCSRSFFAIRTAGNATTTRRFMVDAAIPKKSWLPGVKADGNFVNPVWLDGYLPGDYGFDPCRAWEGPCIPRPKVAEIKHARIAMLATLIFYFEAGQGKTPLGALGL